MTTPQELGAEAKRLVEVAVGNPHINDRWYDCRNAQAAIDRLVAAVSAAPVSPTDDKRTEREACRLRGALQRITEDCTARKAVMIARAALAAPAAPAAPVQPDNGMLTIAVRNLRSYLTKASFSSNVDREAAMNCVEVLEQAAQSAAAVQPPPYTSGTAGEIGTGLDDGRDRAPQSSIGLMDRLERHYAFECEGGPLANCVEWRALRRLVAAVPASPEPREGWQWVPKEPTFEMLEAAADAYDGSSFRESRMYKAMLAAAPRAPVQPEPVAWRYRYSPQGEWKLASEPAAQWAADHSKFEEEPLYPAVKP